MEEDDFLLVQHGLRTTRFLIEAQMRLLGDVDGAPSGEQDAARATLRRLMDLETALRTRADALPGGHRKGRFAA